MKRAERGTGMRLHGRQWKPAQSSRALRAAVASLKVPGRRYRVDSCPLQDAHVCAECFASHGMHVVSASAAAHCILFPVPPKPRLLLPMSQSSPCRTNEVLPPRSLHLLLNLLLSRPDVSHICIAMPALVLQFQLQSLRISLIQFE